MVAAYRMRRHKALAPFNHELPDNIEAVGTKRSAISWVLMRMPRKHSDHFSQFVVGRALGAQPNGSEETGTGNFSETRLKLMRQIADSLVPFAVGAARPFRGIQHRIDESTGTVRPEDGRRSIDVAVPLLAIVQNKAS
jgi:hypothetical protein